MTKVARPTSFGFGSGILTEQLSGRSDFDKYRTALQECENFTVSPLGGIYKRRGFRHIYPALAGSVSPAVRRLIPFDFNSTAGQSYVIEVCFNDTTKVTTFRFFTRGGVVLTSGGIPYTVTTNIITDVAAIRRMAFVQSVDRMYLVDQSFAPFTLSRLGHNSWQIATLTFTTNPAYPLPWKADDYPSRILFFEDRLILAASPSAPTTVWMSRTSQYTNFNINTATAGDTPLATDSIWIRMGGGKLNPIVWLSDRRNLLTGTNDAEFSFSGSAAMEALTPENAGYRREGAYGSSEIMPLSLEDAVVFISRTRKKVFGITLDEYVNTFKVEQLNMLCPEIVSGVQEMAQTEDPYNVIWLQQSNGDLAGCTFVREQNIVAWHTHRVGLPGVGQGQVHSVAAIPTDSGSALWALVYYPDAANNPWRVQVMSDDGEAVFLDSYISGVVVTEGQIPGLEDFVGQTVAVSSSVGFLGEFVVPASGVIESLDFKVGLQVAVGYLFQARALTLPLIFTSQSSTTAGMAKSIHKPTIKFWDSVGGKIRCRYLNQKDELAAGSWSVAPAYPHGARTSRAPAALTYDLTVDIATMFSKEVALEFLHDTPYPCNILSLTYDIIVGGV